jgi:hypothetical protein
MSPSCAIVFENNHHKPKQRHNLENPLPKAHPAPPFYAQSFTPASEL